MKQNTSLAAISAIAMLWPAAASAERTMPADRDRTGALWRSPDGACQALNDHENVRDALDLCSQALMLKVTQRLDGRGNLAWASSAGGVGAVAAAGTPALTLNLWIGLGLLPSFYEDLQGRPMAAIEFYAGYGFAWVGEHYDSLERERDNLNIRMGAVEEKLCGAEQASMAIIELRDVVNSAIAGFDAARRGAGDPTLEQLHATKAELDAQLGEYRRIRLEANNVLTTAQDAARRVNGDGLDQWAEGRFEHVRRIAVGQQLSHRVGPFRAFRTLVALPFGAVADTIRGTSTAELQPIVTAAEINSRLESLPRALGIPDAASAVAAVTAKPENLHASYRQRMVEQTRALTALVDAANTLRGAQTRLAAVDKQTIPSLTLAN